MPRPANRRPSMFVLALAVLLARTGAAQARYDIILLGGRVLDGTGIRFSTRTSASAGTRLSPSAICARRAPPA